MKAAVCSRYGPPEVIRITDVEKPVPKDNKVLIKVRAASVNPLDAGSMKGRPYIVRIMTGLRRPKITRPGVFLARPNKGNLTIMHDLMKAGQVIPIIDKLYRLSEVAEATRYLEERHARGKVVITL